MRIQSSEIARRSSAFTLLELLIVIGIILVLIGILVPVAGKVRQAAQTANTKQMFVRIESGIQAYYSDFQTYPGPFLNAEIGTQPALGGSPLAYYYDSGSGLVQETSRVNITSTENLFLGIVGGLTQTPNFRASINFRSFPTGPASLNTANVKKYQTYIAVEARETTALTPPRSYPGNGAGFGGSADTRVPEFLDAYPQPMPILYLRAMRGNAGIVAANNVQQYNRAHLLAYDFPAAGDATYLSEYGAKLDAAGSNTVLTAGDQSYFGNSSLATPANTVADDSPGKKDEFMLISAGPDGKYGTSDDITNFR